MQVSKHQISLSVAEHPTRNGAQRIIHDIPSIPYMPKEQKNISKAMFNTRKESIKFELSEITKDYDVTGFVVGYPLEETGHPGGRCGRVLHLLDYLADANNGQIINRSRPFTLWDQRVYCHNQFDEKEKPQDKWGRSAAFCHYPRKNGDAEEYQTVCDDFGKLIQMYISNHGKDQIMEGGNNSDCSNRILKQFLNSHYQQNEEKEYFRQSTTVPFERFIQIYEGNVQHFQATTL
jgi:hypothetical protein